MSCILFPTAVGKDDQVKKDDASGQEQNALFGWGKKKDKDGDKDKVRNILLPLPKPVA